MGAPIGGQVGRAVDVNDGAHSAINSLLFESIDLETEPSESDLSSPFNSAASLRLLFVARSLGLGGAERQLVELAKALTARGHTVSVALLYSGGALEAELASAGVPIHFVNKQGRWDLLGPLWRLVALIRRERPEVVHGYLPVANFLATLALLFSRGPKLVFGVRASNMDLSRYDLINRLAYKLESWVASCADLIISNSRAGLNFGWDRGMPRGRGLIIQNGIDTDRFRPDPHASERVGPFQIGMVARFDPMKDHETFVAAAHLIANQRQDVTFVLAGEGTEALSGRVAGLPAQILGGVLQPEDLMAKLDVAVLSSRFGEGFPNAVAEAMAAGVPVAATDVGDTAEIVGETGRIVEPGNPKALADAVLALLETARNPTHRNACRQRIEKRFSIEALVTRTESALVSLRKPTVLHVITGLNGGGAEGMLARLVQTPGAFRQIVVSLIGDGVWGPRLRAADIEVADLGMRRGIPSLGSLWQLVRLIRGLRPVVVQTWMYHADLLGFIAASLARRPPVVWNLRCSNMDLSRYERLTRWVVRASALLSRFPSAIVVNSASGQRWHSKLGYRPRQWVMLPNGLDINRFEPDPQARKSWRTRLGVCDNTILIGMAARRDPMKDHEGLLKALALTSGKFACAMVGAGVDAGDSKLASLAAQTGKPVFLLGYCEDMPGFMSALDIAVLASNFGEGSPNVLLEAMACGVPVVTTDVGDSGDIVGNSGKVVAPGDVAALAAALEELAADPAERMRLGRLARERVRAHYNLPHIAKRYQNLWDQVRK